MSNLYILAGQSNAAGQDFNILSDELAKSDNDFELIEFFLGGTTIFPQSTPGVPDWYPFDDGNAATGELYRGLIDTITAASPGNTPKGMIWIHGEADSARNFHEHYESNLTHFVENMIDLYGADFEIVVVQLSSMAGLYDDRPENWDNVRAAQAQVAENFDNVTLVSTTDLALQHGYDYLGSTTTGFRDDVHYTFQFNALIAERTALAVTGSLPVTDDADTIVRGSGDDLIHAGKGNDTINAGDGENLVFAEIGDDDITSGSGRDIVNGGSGDDIIRTGGGNDLVYGDIGDDALYAGEGNDIVIAGHGDDRVYVDLGDDVLDGGIGVDWLDYSAVTDARINFNLATGTVSGSAFSNGDTFTNFENVAGTVFDDILRGSTGGNVLSGGAGADKLYGRGGDDIILGGNGADYMDGGSGRDALSYSDATGAVTIDLTLNTASGSAFTSGDVFVNFEDGIGSGFNDTLIGSDAENRLYGGAGDDVIDARNGNDFLFGDLGADQLDGGGGRDTLDYSEAEDRGIRIDMLLGTIGGSIFATGDTFSNIEDVTGTDFLDRLYGSNSANRLSGKAGDDIIFARGGNDFVFADEGADRLDGGSGRDNLVYNRALDTGIVIDLITSTVSGSALATGDSFSNFEDVIATAFADSMFGSQEANRLWGRDGDDRIFARGGDDFLFGEDGNDTLVGGAGSDRLDGGAGRDTVVYNDANDTGITINLASGSVSGSLIALGDTITGFEDVMATRFADVIDGSANDNRLIGLAGNDTIRAAGGNDIVFGGTGADTLDGGAGRDTLSYTDATDTGISIDLNTGIVAGSSFVFGDTFSDFEDVIGSKFDDTITGSSGNNRLFGKAGDDIISAGDGNDLVFGGSGADQLDGGTGRDILVFSEARDTGVKINLNLGTVSGSTITTGDTFTGFEGVIGSGFADNITGDAGANRLWGRSGNDTLIGAGGNDILYGERGVDVLRGGLGADLLDGGAGRDFVSYLDADDVGISIDLGTLTVSGSAVTTGDTLVSIENVIGTNFADSIMGSDDVNQLFGKGGDDVIMGGAGTDRLQGDAGSDQLWGGSGKDIFSFFSGLPLNAGDADTIHDFDYQADRLVFDEYGSSFGRDDLIFTDTGTDVEITAVELGDLVITLKGFDIAEIDQIYIAFG